MFKRIKKHLLRGLIILGLLILTGVIFVCFNSVNTLIKFKDVKFDIGRAGERYIFHQGYAIKRENVPAQINLSGTHYEMGLQYGVLLKDETKEMAKIVHKVVTYYSEEMRIPKDLVYIYFKYKINKLVKNIPERYKQEMQGISDGSGVDINAIYTISLFDDIVHSMGCTSILALTEDGLMLHGKNEDLYFGMELGMKAVIIEYNPKGYNSFVSVSFPGFVGVSTGYSNNGLGYSHHSRFANKSNLNSNSQFFVPRMALEECSNLNEVINFYSDKPFVVGDAHSWSDRNNLTGCIIESAPDEKYPTKVTKMTGNVQWHINKYLDPNYILYNENKYTGDESFNNSRQEILSQSINKNQKLSLDNVISLLRTENGPSGENYNMSSVTRGICNIDTNQMIIIDPKGAGIYIARNYYLASKSTVYFIPMDFELSPYVYKESEVIDPVVEDVAIIRESMISQSELIRKLKELTVKYPNHGYIYFLVGQASFDSGNLADWAEYIEKAYELPSSCDIQEVTLEKAMVEFYKKDMQLTKQLLSEINFEALKSFKSKAELLYLYQMYYEAINNKTELQLYKEKFESFVCDSKTQKKIIKRLKVLFGAI